MVKDFQGKLFVFSAPSGSGKTTIVRHLLAQDRFNLEFSISATSREPRSNEKDGVDYYYISLADFKQKIKSEEFLEWEEVYRDNFYGTLKTEVERIWAKGKHVIFDIDVVGGLRIKEKFPECGDAICNQYAKNPKNVQRGGRFLTSSKLEDLEAELQKISNSLKLL